MECMCQRLDRLEILSELTINDRDRDPITDRDHFFGDRDRMEITFWKSDR